jgi:hypothetical protein
MRAVRRVTHFLQAQCVRGHDPDRGIAGRGREQVLGPAGRPAALADGDQRADQRAHHVVAERVGHHRGDQDAGLVPVPVQAAQRPHGGRSRPAPAEGGEVVLTQAARGRLVHGGHVKPPEVPERLVPAHRVRGGPVVAHAVGVTPPQRGEPRVEPVGSRTRRAGADVGGQDPVQPGQHAVRAPQRRRGPGGRGHVRVHDLPARVHARVRAPGHGQRGRPRQPQHLAEGRRHDALHRAPAGLGSPPGKR